MSQRETLAPLSGSTWTIRGPPMNQSRPASLVTRNGGVTCTTVWLATAVWLARCGVSCNGGATRNGGMSCTLRLCRLTWGEAMPRR